MSRGQASLFLEELALFERRKRLCRNRLHRREGCRGFCDKMSKFTRISGRAISLRVEILAWYNLEV
jgi:hypothetical protein